MRRLTKVKIVEISAVDRPAQAHARAVIIKRATELRKLKPHDGEGEQEFVSRFMGDARTREEFPDEKQRAAVAHSMWRERHQKDQRPDGAAPAGPVAKGLSQAGTTAADGGDLENRMTPEEKAALEKAAKEQLEAMQKRAERAEKLAQLNDAEKALLSKMDKAGQEQFLALSPEQRQVEVAKAREADPVVFTDMDGNTFRKSEDPRLVALAKRADEERKARLQAEVLAKQEKLQKRAEELRGLPGSAEDKVALLGAIDSLPAERRAGAEALLKAANSTLAKALRTLGTADQGQDDNPETGIEKIATAIREREPKLTAEQAYLKALETREGRQLYASRRS